MTEYQKQRVSQQRNNANRLTRKARTSKVKRDQINAGWALNTLVRMSQEAGEKHDH